MIRKNCQSQQWLGLCCPRPSPCEQLEPIITPLNLNFTKNNRISLKRFKSRQFQDVRQVLSPPSQQPTNTPTQQTLPPTPKSSLPKIAFSWSNPVVPPPKLQVPEGGRQQSREDLAKKTHYKQLKRSFMAYRTSIVSIKSGSSFKDPRFQQSLILVDYFHPTSHQLDQMAPLLSQQFAN